MIGLILAYFIRFYSLAFNGIKSNYLKMNQSIDESSYLLGYSKFNPQILADSGVIQGVAVTNNTTTTLKHFNKSIYQIFRR